MSAILELLFIIGVLAIPAVIVGKQWVFWVLLALLVFHETNKSRGPYFDSDYEYDQLYDPYSEHEYEQFYRRR